MTNFQVPLLEDNTSVTPKKANEQAFYAAVSSDSPDPITDFQKAKSDLIETGNSNFIDSEQQKWNAESDMATKETISGIIADKTISPDIKQAVLRGYATTGAIPITLKDRYIQRTAAADTSSNLEDVKSQDEIINNLQQRIDANSLRDTEDKIHSGASDFLNVMGSSYKGLASIVTSTAMSIPAGLAGLFSLIKDQDPQTASEIISHIQQLAYNPSDEKAQQVKQFVLEKASILGIPAKKIGEFIFEKTGSAGAATTAEIALDPLNYVGLGVGKAARALRLSRTMPKVAEESALKVTEAANPKKAEALGAAAVTDETGKLAEAMNTNKGEIVQDWTLPKLFPEQVAKSHPDLLAKIKEADRTIHETFQDLRYDPNLINVTKREEETAKIYSIMKESRAPYYNQSMSLINETDSLFEGTAVYGRNGGYGYAREGDAQRAYENLKQSIDQLPEDLRGELNIYKLDGQYYIAHQWKKVNDELADLTFGKDSIKTSIFGLDVSNIARSSIGRWLFPTGRLPKNVENAALTGVDRAARAKDDITKIIRAHIAPTKHGRELDYLINYAEENGIDYISPSKIASFFPKLSAAEAKSLFETHTWWRRVQQYHHNFMNREYRKQLLGSNMEGMYDQAGNYLGPATSKISEKEYADISSVWDMERGVSTKFDRVEAEKTGKKLIRLHEKVVDGNNIYHYGIVGGKIQLNILPREVLARVPGYSPRKVKESWYVDITPKSLVVNGLKKSNTDGLRQYTETRAAARTEDEANKIAAQLQADNPEHIVTARPERQDNWGRVLTDYQIHQEFLKHSMKRGERLPSINGPARLEDRMTTLINTVNTISRIGAYSAWDAAFQRAFTKGFSKFTKGEFPQYATDIKPLENMGRELKQEYDTAHAMFKYYERMKNSETRGDFLWTKGLNTIADILEKFKIPADMLHGKHQNPLMLGKTIATAAYIHLAPVRQWLVQPAQQLEMYAINPKTAAKNFSNTLAIRMYLSADANIIKQSGGAGVIKKMARDAGEKAGEKEFIETAEAIRKSGVLQAVDMNSIVHGVFKEANRALVESTPEKIWKSIETAAKAIPRASRAVGFDAAELTNRVGNWLQVRDIWREQNPGKSWKTKEAQSEIAAEAAKLSGAMNRAGQLPYQEGTLSIFFQFAAINHKMLMNLIQDNATILSKSQRARLAAARIALYGGKYGIPGGAIAYHFIEGSDDPEVKKYAEQIKRGAVDYAANKTLAAITEPDVEPDLAFSRILTPYSEGFMPYFDVGWETMKMFDDKPQGPRYPAFGMVSSFGQAIEDMQGWWITRDVAPDDVNTLSRMIAEATELGSGFNNYARGLLMMGIHDRVTKSGNHYGLQFSKAEAYARMFAGVGTQKEEDLWRAVELVQDHKREKHEMAKVIHRQMMNQRSKLNDEDYAHQVQRMNSFINLLDPIHFTEADKLDVINEVERLDRRSYTTIKQSILAEHFKYHQDRRSAEWREVDDILRRSPDPETQRYIKALDEGKL